jgi:hypothetical protein
VRYALRPYIKQIHFVLKRLNSQKILVETEMTVTSAISDYILLTNHVMLISA